MALEIRQNLKTSQRLSLSTELKNSIAILNLPRNDLERFVGEELERNPCLLSSTFNKDEKGVRDLNRTSSYSVGQQFLGSGTTNRKEFVEMADNVDLHESLEDQLATMRLSPHEFQCGQILLQYIDDNGFLDTELQEIAEEHDLHLDDLSYALEAVQKCEPTGVGARNVRECLQLQLKELDNPPKMVERILNRHWQEFEKQNFIKIARLEEIDVEEIKKACRFISANFDPKPARQFGGQMSQHIVPDVYVFKRGSNWLCSTNLGGLPRLRLSQKYQDLMSNLKKHNDSMETKQACKYLSENLKAAKWLMRSLAERDKTILKVTEIILQHQLGFFEEGVESLGPLTLKTVALELDLHESTISRATSGKYLFCQRGIFELKYFFNSVVQSDSGKDITNESIKKWILELVKTESKVKPLCDQKIADRIIAEKQVQISRRTVTKYREAAGILPSSKRTKKF